MSAALAGIELHVLQPGHRYSGAPSRLAAWLAQSAGLYDRLQFPPDCDPAEGILTAGGHGGELAKGMWRWWRVTTLTLAAPIRCQSSLRAECRRGLAGMGLSPRVRASAEWHYLGFRNAIHGGRQSAAFLLNSSPLMQRSLVSLAHSGLCAHPLPKRGAASIISDLNIVLRPEMAVHRYKDDLAFMSATHVASRLAALGGPLARAAADPYETHARSPRRANQVVPRLPRPRVAAGGAGLGRRPERDRHRPRRVGALSAGRRLHLPADGGEAQGRQDPRRRPDRRRGLHGGQARGAAPAGLTTAVPQNSSPAGSSSSASPPGLQRRPRRRPVVEQARGAQLGEPGQVALGFEPEVVEEALRHHEGHRPARASSAAGRACTQPSSISWSSVPPDTETPRISSISARVTGWW